MKKYKYFSYAFIAVVVITGLFNIGLGFYNEENWQIIAGFWQIVAMGYWALIPNDYAGSSKEVVK